MQLHLHRHGQPLLAGAEASKRGWRAPRAASAQPRPVRTRSWPGAAPRAPADRRAAGRRSRRRCGPRPGCTAVPAPGRDGVVEVLGVVGIDREGGQRSVRSTRDVRRVRLPHRVLGLCLPCARIASVQSAIEHQALHHVAGDVRPPEPAHHAAAAALPEPTNTRSPSSAPPRPSTAVAGRVRRAARPRGSGPRFSSTATSGWSSRRCGRPRTAELTELFGPVRRALRAGPRRAWSSDRPRP